MFNSFTINNNFYTITDDIGYQFIEITESEKIVEFCNELLKMRLKDEVYTQVYKYNRNMKRLLSIYNNGKGKEKFKEKEMSLYFKLQDEFSDIIDLRYNIYDNKINTENKFFIVNTLDKIIKVNRSIIEDINSILI